MKNFMLSAIALMIAAGTASANLLIGWDGGTTSNSSTNMTGITGNLWANNIVEVDTTAGSTDGTYGPTITGASTAANAAYEVRTVNDGAKGTLGVQIINSMGTGQELSLDKLVFDYGRWFGAGATNVTISYAFGDLNLANNTEIQTIAGTVTGKAGDYGDFEIDLTGLSDFVLADGEKATFQLVVSNSGSDTSSSAFDNVGFTGSVIPEPATLGLIAMAGMGIVCARRIMM